MIKTYKVRLEPNNLQNTKLFQSASTARWAYNWVLAKQQKNFKDGGKFLQDGVIRKELTQLKKTPEYYWLFESSNNVTKQAIKDACNAYKRFFKNQNKLPKFKTRKNSKPSFYNSNDKIKFTKSHVHLEKIGKVKLSEKSRIPYGDITYYNPRVKFDGVHWHLTVGVDIINLKDETLTGDSLGIDLGIKELAVISNGNVYPNINKTERVKRINKKIKRMQRQVSRKYEMNKDVDKFKKTKNINKLEIKIKSQYIKLKNIRFDYLHKTTTEIVKTKPSRIVVEDLNVSGMMKNKHLAKAISVQSFYTFTEILRYKCDINGVDLVKASRWYPSSKTCSCCGAIKKDLKLSDRVYFCTHCVTTIDRDLNAALNLAKYTIK